MSTKIIPAELLNTYRAELEANGYVERENVHIYSRLHQNRTKLTATIRIDGELHGLEGRNIEPALREFTRLVDARRAERAPVTVETLLSLLDRAADSIEHDWHASFAAEIRTKVAAYRQQQNPDRLTRQ